MGWHDGDNFLGKLKILLEVRTPIHPHLPITKKTMLIGKRVIMVLTSRQVNYLIGWANPYIKIKLKRDLAVDVCICSSSSLFF